MKMKYVKRVISLILSIAILTTSFEWNKVYAVERTNNSDEKFFTEVTPGSDATTDEEISEELEVMETDGNFKELPEHRTPNSTTFVLSDNQYRTDYYASDVRYEDENGNLIDFDSSLKKLKKNEKTSEGDRDLSGYKYENIAGEKKNYFPEKISEDTPVLMENDDYAIKITPCIEDKAIAFDDVSIDKEEIENIYGDTEEKIISASYESDEEVFQYESENNGIKESIILNEYQGNNVWKFKLQLEGGIQAKKYNKGILFKDSKTDEIVGCIEPPYMNDASNDNYSEKIEYEIQKLEEDSESVTYELTMNVDEEYLTSKDTKYPVVIDPTYTWTGNSGITDVYVLGAANYQSKNNYNNNANTIMAGKLTSKGIVRTYLSFSGLADKIKDKSVESLKLSLYETGSGKSNVSVCAYKTSSSYSAKTLTWTNRPGYNTLLDTQTSTGKSAKEKVFDITAYGRSVSKGNNDFGIMLRASDESTANVYAEFYGTRSSKSSYLPKVSVVYYDVPTTPDTISVSPKYVKKGSPLTVSWTGIKSYSLSEIQYRICKFDAANKSEIGTVSSYADNASIGKTKSGSATISSVNKLSDGTYKIVIRGKDKNGYVGVGKGSSFTIDGTKPTLSSVVISPSTSSTNYSDYAPSISFSGVSDVNFERVEYKVGTTGSYTTLATTTSGKYTLPEGLFTKTQAYKIYVRSVDKAGNVSNEVVNTYYYKDYVSEISDYDVDKIQIRETASGKTRLKWSCKEKGTLPADIYYQVYRSTSSSCDINSANLVADNIKDFTTVVYNGTSNVKYYYRVRAVRNNKSGTKTYGASSPLVNSVSIDDELSLRNGLIDILEYDEIEASQGVGYVEKTTGNFTYTENDIMLPCADMPYGISRYYNSNSRLTGSFGNWTSVWDCRIEEDRNDIVYFRDYTGAIYTLINRGDGTYTSDIVENLSLTRCNKSIIKIVKNGSGKKAIRCDCAYQFENPDNSAFYFNKKGDLLLIENNNGTFQALEYNDYGVVSKIWASNGPSLELKYSQTSLAMGKPLIERINLPNGIYFSYVYEDGKLIKAIFYSNNISKYGASHYEYSYNSNGKLYYLFDPYCNRIVVSYSNNRVSQIVYPDREKVCYEYQPANYKTTVKEYSPESVLLRSEITTYSPGYGMPERHEESDGNTIINTYRGTKANSSRMKVDYNTISGDVIYDNQIYVSENIEYDSEGRISKIIDSAGNNISYTYCTTKGLTHLPQRVVTTDTSGKVVSDKTYRYNYKGDIIEEKENVDNVKVNLQYDNQGNIIKEEGYIKDKEAYISEYEYDENGEEIKSDEISGTVALSEETRYDVMGNVTYTKDDTGLETYYTYDGYGRPESTRFIKGNTVDVEYTYYNINGRLARKVNIDGSITQYEYDCMNRVIKETYTKGGQSRQYVYEYGYTKDSIKIYVVRQSI